VCFVPLVINPQDRHGNDFLAPNYNGWIIFFLRSPGAKVSAIRALYEAPPTDPPLEPARAQGGTGTRTGGMGDPSKERPESLPLCEDSGLLFFIVDSPLGRGRRLMAGSDLKTPPPTRERASRPTLGF